nr:hypothetical protein [Tanacetum cinerariifolium]
MVRAKRSGERENMKPNRIKIGRTKNMQKLINLKQPMDHGACSFWGGVVEVMESVRNVEEWQESGERWCLKEENRVLPGIHILDYQEGVGSARDVLMAIFSNGGSLGCLILISPRGYGVYAR